jgi:hypothetical protein
MLMKIQKITAIVLIATAFFSGLGHLPSQAQKNIHSTPKSSDDLSKMVSITSIEAKQNLKRTRAPMDDILGLTNEQVIKKDNLLLQFSNEINAVTKELSDGINNPQTRDATVAISRERKTAISKKLFAGVRGILTPKQLQNKKAQNFLASYENFLLKLVQNP